MQRSAAYILAFAAVICVVCGILVSSAAVTLEKRQQTNAELERRTNVLLAAGLTKSGEKLDADQVAELFEAVRVKVIDLQSGRVDEAIDARTFDQQRAKLDPERSREAPENSAGIKRLPNHALVYEVLDQAGAIDLYVLPIEGLGLWSTLFGFVAIDHDTTTIRGLTYYQHGETPGLGGEVDNPKWKQLWPGRRVFDDNGRIAISVIKGRAGSASDDPYRVDGLSGATITSRGVGAMLRFWLGDNGFGPFLENSRSSTEAA
jgi:Na+-transporting NADH:ubiquinone oxidoreductase subunit C